MGEEELLALGQARRQMGQKGGEWTPELNRNMMNKMGADGSGNVARAQFVAFFNDKLSNEEREFNKEIEQFLACARALGDKKKKLQEDRSRVERREQVGQGARTGQGKGG